MRLRLEKNSTLLLPDKRKAYHMDMSDHTRYFLLTNLQNIIYSVYDINFSTSSILRRSNSFSASYDATDS